ncbi:MAG: acetyl-CoA carboxylase biotin carboxyl carrier protein [Balneolaceae bacterium]|nr:acetyl-CoA carboxylase biotin carboxyl carrier protein [Balneolaceae bacterium]
MDLKLIKNILTMISDSDVDEVSIEEGDFKIKVKKTGTVEQITYTQPAAAPAAPAQPAPPQAPAQPAPTAESASKPTASGETVKSPIVGTYYQAASPDSDPFVKVGDTVQKGQTLCIIEAMKIMNEIEAEFGGTLKEILVTDGTPVEFDQPLFIIEKS